LNQKKYGIAMGSPKFSTLVPFQYDNIKRQEYFPQLFEVYQNGRVDLCYFANYELFLKVFWYNTSQKKLIKYNMFLPENSLFKYILPTCKNDLEHIVKILKKDFDKTYNKSYLTGTRNNYLLPNSIVANTLTLALLEYVYYKSSGSDEEYQTIVDKCKHRISEYATNSIPKIITQKKISDLNLYWVVDSRLPDGTLHLQYSEFFETRNTKL
jgi:hypothetical protein